MIHRNRHVLAAGLIVWPLLLLPLLQVLGWTATSTAQETLVGIAITALGGIITGAISERLLGRGRNSSEQAVGLFAVTTLGVITIGILYLLQIRGPMSSIGTPERAVNQIVAFAEFLTAQAAGILLSAGR